MSAADLLLAVEGEREGIDLLIPAPNELFWGTVAFAVFLLFVSKYVMPRARQTLHARTEGIEGRLERAEQAQAEAAETLEQYKAQLADAREEAGRIRNEAQAQRAQIVEEARGEARVEATRIVEAGQAQISSERLQAMSELRRELGTLSVELASRIVGESLEDDARQRRTVDRFLESLEQAAPSGTSS